MLMLFGGLIAGDALGHKPEKKQETSAKKKKADWEVGSVISDGAGPLKVATPRLLMSTGCLSGSVVIVCELSYLKAKCSQLHMD